MWDFANLRVPGIIRLLSKINIKSYLYLSYKNPLLQVKRMQVLVKLILVTPCVGIIQALHNPTDKIETNRHYTVALYARSTAHYQLTRYDHRV